MVMPEIVSIIDKESAERAVEVAAGVLRRGGVIIYPTDTLYGLGADSLNAGAVRKVFRIKGRESDEPLSNIVLNMDMTEQYAYVTPHARVLAEAFLPGPLTLILKKREGVRGAVGGGASTFGVRVPASEFCLKLAERFGGPYTSTSANISGEESGQSVEEILEQLGDGAALIDLVIDGGTLESRTPSTIVDVTGERARILREGVIPREDIDGSLSKR